MVGSLPPTGFFFLLMLHKALKEKKKEKERKTQMVESCSVGNKPGGSLGRAYGLQWGPLKAKWTEGTPAYWCLRLYKDNEGLRMQGKLMKERAFSGGMLSRRHWENARFILLHNKKEKWRVFNPPSPKWTRPKQFVASAVNSFREEPTYFRAELSKNNLSHQFWDIFSVFCQEFN